MIKTSRHIDMLQCVAEGLKELLPTVVFVGGAASVLYINPATSAEPRPTDDVDCVVEISSQWQRAEFESKLRTLDFKHDTRKEAPACRWLYSGLVVDIMPADTEILGFSNSWYKDGISHKEKRTLGNGAIIFVFPLPYFLASKLEAYHSRGQDDPRTSSDMEDILLVLDGHDNPLGLIEGSERPVKTFLRSEFRNLNKNRDFWEAVEGLLAREGAGRIARIHDLLDSIGNLKISA